MKKTLSLLILLTGVMAWAQTQETTVQVVPSDQVVYPDASQILNKSTPLPSSKPLLGAAPVPARPVPAAAPQAVPPAPAAEHGWFLRWTVTGDEAGVRAWAAGLGSGIRMTALGPDLWEVLAGPLTAGGLGQALEGQAGKSQLIKR